jgi:transmembrane protein 231
MPLYEVYSHSNRFHYRATLFSLATCFLILCAALTFLPPFLFAYFADGFWIKEGLYSEQARLNYSSQYIVIIDNDAVINNQFFASSYESLNSAFQNVLISESGNFLAIDKDGDGITDQFSITFDLLFSTSPTINNINVWLIFKYQLRARQYITMETMALINLAPPPTLDLSLNPNVTVVGNLILEQRQPIQSSGFDTTYDTSIIDVDSLLATSSLDLNPVLEEYFTRKYYTSYQSEYVTWKRGTNNVSDILTMNIFVNINSQSIRFIPGFWQEFKWGWIQYLCVLLPFIIVFNRIKEFVFRNQTVRTFVEAPYHRHKA